VVEGYRADELVLSVKDERALAAAQGDDDVEAITMRAKALPTVETTVPAEEPDEAKKDGTLVGTIWLGLSAESGEYTIEFLKAGKLRYSFLVTENNVSVQKAVSGTWHQLGNDVLISIAEYSSLQGTLEGDVIKGEGSNIEGLKWNFKLLKKK